MLGPYLTKVDYWLNPSQKFQRAIKGLARNRTRLKGRAETVAAPQRPARRALAITRTASISSGRVAHEQTKRNAPSGQG